MSNRQACGAMAAFTLVSYISADTVSVVVALLTDIERTAYIATVKSSARFCAVVVLQCGGARARQGYLLGKTVSVSMKSTL